MRNTSVTLGERFSKFANAQVENGYYESVSEVVRAGLRILAEREEKITALRTAIIQGEQSGIGNYSLEKILATTKCSN